MWHLDVAPVRVANADESRQGKSSRIVQRSNITQRVVSFPYAFLRIDLDRYLTIDLPLVRFPCVSLCHLHTR
jgi:hypothetical protein